MPLPLSLIKSPAAAAGITRKQAQGNRAPTEALGNWKLNAGDLKSSVHLRPFLPVAAEFVELVFMWLVDSSHPPGNLCSSASFLCLLQLFGHTVWFILWEMGFGMGMKGFPGGASDEEPACQSR